MGNRNSAPRYQKAYRQVADIPVVNLAEVQVGSPAAAGAAYTAAQGFADISKRMEDRLDISAAKEAVQEGRAAGEHGLPQLRDEETIRDAAFNQAAMDSVRTEFDLKARLKLGELEEQYAADPDKFLSQSQAFIQGHVSALKEEGYADIAHEIGSSFELNRANALSRVKKKQISVMRDKQAEGVRLSQKQAEEDVIKTARGLLDASPEEMPKVLAQLSDIAGKAYDAAGQLGPDGTPLFSAEGRMALQSRIGKNIAKQVGLSWIERQPDMEAAIEQWQNGQAFVEIIGEDGEKAQVNLEEALGVSAAQSATPYISRAAKSKSSQVKAAQEYSAAQVNSNLDLKIETAGDFETLEALLSDIDNSEEVVGLVKANNLRKKVFSKQEKYRQQNDELALGALFARGDAMLNPEDDKSKKAYNTFYSAVHNDLAGLPPEERNIAVTQIVSNAGVVPDLLKGDMRVASRSKDSEVVAQAADLIDRIATESPQLINQLGSEKDIARIQMVNDRMAAGYDAEEALKVVDMQLDPAKAPLNEHINAELSKITKNMDFREDAVSAVSGFGDYLKSWLPFRDDLSEGNIAVQGEIDQAQAVYRMAYEDAYRLTRDKAQAERSANIKVQGQFGKTQINGNRTQIMRYPPEKYYSINGLSEDENTDWMREQMIAEARRITKDDFVQRTKKEFKENLVLMPVPSVTSRTSSMGKPVYALVYIKDGIPQNLLGENQYFTFDQDKARADLIEKAKEPEKPLRIFPTGRYN